MIYNILRKRTLNNDIIPEIAIVLHYYSSNSLIGDTIDGYEGQTCIVIDQAVDTLGVQQELIEQGLALKNT